MLVAFERRNIYGQFLYMTSLLLITRLRGITKSHLILRLTASFAVQRSGDERNARLAHVRYTWSYKFRLTHITLGIRLGRRP